MPKRAEQTETEILVISCQQGDPVAFDRLICLWQERLWSHALRLTGHEDAAWDVLQESLLAISQQIRRLSEVESFGAWAYRITSNKSRDWIRKENSRRRALSDYAVSTQAIQQDKENSRQGLEDLSDAIATLSGEEQTLVELYYKESFSTDEIGLILGIPPGKVKSRLFKLRQTIKGRMEDL